MREPDATAIIVMHRPRGARSPLAVGARNKSDPIPHLRRLVPLGKIAAVEKHARSAVNQIRRRGGQEEILGRIEAALRELARDTAKSAGFRDAFSTWLATEFSLEELKAYYAWLQSPLAQKIADFDLRLRPMEAEQLLRLERGRLLEVRSLIETANFLQRKRDEPERSPSAETPKSPPAQRASPPPPPPPPPAFEPFTPPLPKPLPVEPNR